MNKEMHKEIYKPMFSLEQSPPPSFKGLRCFRWVEIDNYYCTVNIYQYKEEELSNPVKRPPSWAVDDTLGRKMFLGTKFRYLYLDWLARRQTYYEELYRDTLDDVRTDEHKKLGSTSWGV